MANSTKRNPGPGEVRILYDENYIPYLLEATNDQAAKIVALLDRNAVCKNCYFWSEKADGFGEERVCKFFSLMGHCENYTDPDDFCSNYEPRRDHHE